MNVPEIWSSVPNRKFFQKKFGSLNIVNGAVKLVHNVLALGEVVDLVFVKFQVEDRTFLERQTSFYGSLPPFHQTPVMGCFLVIEIS